jgi:hypothetical protein
MMVRKGRRTRMGKAERRQGKKGAQRTMCGHEERRREEAERGSGKETARIAQDAMTNGCIPVWGSSSRRIKRLT